MPHICFLTLLAGLLNLLYAHDANAVEDLVAQGHDSRIDLVWTPSPDGRDGYDIYRSTDMEGPFEKLNHYPHRVHVYSDFLGENDRTFFYRVATAEHSSAGPSIMSAPVQAAQSICSIA